MISKSNTQPLGKAATRVESWPPPNTLVANFRKGAMPAGCSFTRASSGGHFTATGQWATALTNTPRFDHDPATGQCRGLLVEESRTNSLRNNTMSGAAAGALGGSGSLPTYWSISGQGTLTASVATGLENGMEYLDLTLSGTTSTTSVTLLLEQTNGISTSASQAWVASGWFKLAGGSAAGLTTSLQVCTNAGVQSTTAVTLGGNLVRYDAAKTTASGTTHVYAQVQVGFASGVSVNATLRLALPQLERGTGATSMIKTSGAIATRMPDLPIWNTLGPWFNVNAGTVVGDFTTIQKPFSANIVNLSDGTSANRITIRGIAGSSQMGIGMVAAGGVQATTTNQAWSLARQRVGGSWRVSGGSCTVVTCTAGTSPATLTGLTMPTGISRLELVRATGVATNYYIGWIHEVQVIPHAASEGELAALTQF